MALSRRSIPLSTFQIELIAGRHLVAVKAGAVIVVAHRDGSKLDKSSAAAITATALLRIVDEARELGGEQFGETFTRLVDRWSADKDDDVEFAGVAPATTGISIYLRGEVGVSVKHPRGSEELIGTKGEPFVDLIPLTGGRAAVFIMEPGADPEIPNEAGVGSLVEGIAQATGAVVWMADVEMKGKVEPGTRDRDPAEDPVAVAPPVPTPEPEPEPPPAPAPAPAPKPPPFPSPKAPVAPRDVGNMGTLPGHIAFALPNVELQPPKVFESFSAEDNPPPKRPPLPPVREAPRPPPHPVLPPPDPRVPQAPPQDRPPAPPNDRLVQGVLCAVGHLNDPVAAFCRVCGRRMDHTKIVVEGERPALGVLVVDDGSAIVLHGGCVFGREPERSEPARRGATPIRLADHSGQMSRAHAEIRLVGWEVMVVDLGSTNGTFVRLPGDHQPRRLNPGTAMTLIPGAELKIGGRTLKFDSANARI